MLSANERKQALELTEALFARVGIVLTPDGVQNIEIADFGLGELEKQGLRSLSRSTC